MISSLSRREYGHNRITKSQFGVKDCPTTIHLADFFRNLGSEGAFVIFGFTNDGECVVVMKDTFLQFYYLKIGLSSMEIGPMKYSVDLAPRRHSRPIIFDFIELCIAGQSPDIVCGCRYIVTENVLARLESRCYIYFISNHRMLYSTDIIALPGSLQSFSLNSYPNIRRGNAFVVSCRRYVTFFLIYFNCPVMEPASETPIGVVLSGESWSDNITKPIFCNVHCKHSPNCWLEVSGPCRRDICCLNQTKLDENTEARGSTRNRGAVTDMQESATSIKSTEIEVTAQQLSSSSSSSSSLVDRLPLQHQSQRILSPVQQNRTRYTPPLPNEERLPTPVKRITLHIDRLGHAIIQKYYPNMDLTKGLLDIDGAFVGKDNLLVGNRVMISIAATLRNTKGILLNIAFLTIIDFIYGKAQVHRFCNLDELSAKLQQTKMTESGGNYYQELTASSINSTGNGDIVEPLRFLRVTNDAYVNIIRESCHDYSPAGDFHACKLCNDVLAVDSVSKVGLTHPFLPYMLCL